MRKRRFGDRKDGRRVRTAPPMTKLEPYIMRRRSDAQNFFADSLNIEKTEKFCREKVKEGKTNFSILHVILAAYSRTVSQRPALNRFISGQKLYSRDDEIVINMAVKKEMTIEAEDTMIKVVLSPSDTIDEVYEKFNKVVTDALSTSGGTSFDGVAKFLSIIPGFIFRGIFKLLDHLDYHGWLPKFLTNEVSPFHGSMIITSMGSLGIKPVYHHLYDFGNLPVFLAYGSKQTEYKLASDGTVVKHKYIDLKAVTDERICDGFYYASCFKLIKRYVENPEMLLAPPEKIYKDID
ncbi:MAG: hypothetical protein E7623_03520 [Ruminococcaceae bacterium]|nr:hypothetical protein [Oscillospiraceae bacterium]